MAQQTCHAVYLSRPAQTQPVIQPNSKQVDGGRTSATPSLANLMKQNPYCWNPQVAATKTVRKIKVLLSDYGGSQETRQTSANRRIS